MDWEAIFAKSQPLFAHGKGYSHLRNFMIFLLVMMLISDDLKPLPNNWLHQPTTLIGDLDPHLAVKTLKETSNTGLAEMVALQGKILPKPLTDTLVAQITTGPMAVQIHSQVPNL